MKKMVDQLMPLFPSSEAPYQNPDVKMDGRFSVPQMARIECMQTPNTSARTSAPLARVI